MSQPSTNHLKFGSSGISSATRGGFSVGVKEGADYGPTSSTGFWNGVKPPVGGYTIYVDKASQGPSIHVASNDSQCISILLRMGATGSTIGNVLDWASTQSNMAVLSAELTLGDLPGAGPNIVTSGLISNLDAGNVSSYSGTGTAWNDLSGNGNNATLTNTTFNSTNGGGIVFGQNGYGAHTLGTSPYAGDFTFTTVFKHTNGYNYSPDWDYLYTMNEYSNGLFFGTQADKPRMSYGNWFTDGINTTGQSTLTLNNYYMLTYGRSGSSLFCYLQNTSYGTGNSTSVTPTITTPYIGTTPNSNRNGEYWSGIINVILVYNRSLSGSEITQNYNALQSRFGF